MRENIEWLIRQYTDEIEKAEQSRREESGIGIYLATKIGVYSKVVNDLVELLDESEKEE